MENTYYFSLSSIFDISYILGRLDILSISSTFYTPGTLSISGTLDFVDEFNIFIISNY